MGLDFRKKPSPVGLSSTGTGYPGQWWNDHPLEVFRRDVEVALRDIGLVVTLTVLDKQLNSVI